VGKSSGFYSAEKLMRFQSNISLILFWYRVEIRLGLRIFQWWMRRYRFAISFSTSLSLRRTRFLF
jgi:hypothetical protein